MGYMIEYMRHKVWCDTAADVRALLGREGAAPVIEAKPSTGTPVSSEKALATSVAFLEAVLSNGPSGIKGADLVDRMGFKSPKSLGGAMGFINGILNELKFSEKKVYEKIKRADATYWFPRADATVALKAVQEIMGGNGNRQ